MLQMMKLWHKVGNKLAQHQPASEWQRKNLKLRILPLKSLLITTTVYCFLTDDLKSLLNTAEERISELEDKSKVIYNIEVIVRRKLRRV